MVDKKKEQYTIPIVRHSCEMITEEYVYKNEFRFQRTQKHGIWFVTYQNHLITFGQYRHDLEEWIDSNYTSYIPNGPKDTKESLERQNKCSHTAKDEDENPFPVCEKCGEEYFSGI